VPLKIDYQKELNPAQLEAVRSTDGPHLVIAGAGSGKTRVLVYRVAYLVEKGARPDQVLLLTFTRKAAEEMLRRAAGLLDERCKRVSGGTFHSFAHLALRRYAPLLGIANNFTILDEEDACDAINLIRAQLGLHKTDKRFPRKKALLEVISKSVNKSEDIEAVLYEEYPQFIEWVEQVKKVRAAYAKYKREKSLLDYDDLLVFLKDLLVNHEQVRLRLSRAYQYIMVDEYQDTNKLQAYIACLLAAEHKNIMVVGDDCQSIYSFRGADVNNIMDFPKLFPGAKVITLEENYRSTQPILDLTNAVIRQARGQFEKNLFTRKQAKELPVFVEAADENVQSKYIAEKILQLREEGRGLGEIAVLFRSGWHSNDLEVELASRGIPFAKYGGLKFSEAAHIKDVLAYLRIVLNSSDEVSWYRCLLLIPGIGPKSAEKIIAAKLQGGKMPLAGARLDEVNKLFALFKEAPSAAAPEELAAAFIKYYQPLLREKYDDFHKRLNDLDSLLRIAGRYDALESFLSDMALEPPERGSAEAGFKDKDDQRLALSTIHSAKGLEWHTVFVIYCCEGHLPSYLSLENEEDIEEERRLLYVACTRAKDNLFLLKPRLDRDIFTQPSRFLSEGGILGRYARIESAGDEETAAWAQDDGLPFGSISSDRRFLQRMKEYFRDQEDY
jgi:DNA helicase-2/ATP-dependent DNA helicase PcrA